MCMVTLWFKNHKLYIIALHDVNYIYHITCSFVDERISNSSRSSHLYGCKTWGQHNGACWELFTTLVWPGEKKTYFLEGRKKTKTGQERGCCRQAPSGPKAAAKGDAADLQPEGAGCTYYPTKGGTGSSYRSYKPT